MANKNEVLFTLKLVQKGDKITIVKENTRKLGQETEKLDKKRKKLTKTTDAYNRREKGAAQISSNSTKNFSKMAQGIDGGGGSGGLVRAYALLAANVFALSAAFGILSRSAQIDTLTQSMRQLEITSGKSVVGVARNLQEAAGFGLDFAESMRAVSLATSAGFGGAQIEQLGEVARNAAVSLGRNLPDALDRIFRGVIKVEPELLDEIGLFVRVNDAAAKYASTLNVAVGDLTEFQKRQAFLTEAVEQGTSKFAAFADIENDSFALLATTFSDMTQGILSFINQGITPLVKMLATNKALFSAVFAAIAIALLRLAVPAMAAFTNSIATNAAKTAEAAQEAATLAKQKSQLSNAQHKEYMKDAMQKLQMESKILQAQTQKGPINKLRVRGGKSKELEKDLKKELGINGRIEAVKQRILDITTKAGFKAREKNKDIQKELSLLRQEEVVHKEILNLQRQQQGAGGFEAIRNGSVASMVGLKAMKASLLANGLAMVANTAQTQGLRLALSQINLELQQVVVKAGLAGVSLTFLDKVLFKVKAGAIAFGIAAQGMWMKLMGPLSILLMLLPLLQAFNKWTGIGSKSAEELSKANESSAEALELLGPRLEHVRSQLKLIGDGDAKSYNKGMDSFKQTVLTTTTAIQEQQIAFDKYVASANGWAQFWGESLPSAFGGGTANAIKKGKEEMITELRAMGNDVTPTMLSLFKTMDENTEKRNKRKGGNVNYKNNTEEQTEIDTNSNAIIAQATLEAEAFVNVRSAIEGAKDSARAFSNSLIVTTQVDKPLASMRQLETSLLNQNITTKERKELIKEIADDSAILSMLSKEQVTILKDGEKEDKARLAVITEAKDSYFEQQKSLIISAATLKRIAVESKNIASLNKVSEAAIELTYKNEKKVGEIKAEQAKFAKENALKGQDLTEQELTKYNLGEKLLDIVGKERFLKLDLKAVQAASNKLVEEDLVLLQNKFDIYTSIARQARDEAAARLNEIKDSEKINKIALKRLMLEASITKFKSTGSTNLTTLNKLANIVEKEKSLEKTRLKRATEEAIIAKSNKEIEARKLDALGEGYEDAAQVLRDAGVDIYESIIDGANQGALAFKKELADLFSEVLKGSTLGADTFGSDSLAGGITAGSSIALSKDSAGKDIFDETERQTMAFKIMEDALLSLAGTITEVLGSEGVLAAALASSSAGFVSLGTGYAEAMKEAGTVSEKVAATASAIASGIGQVISLVSASAQSNVQDIDKMISAEKKRDGKSEASVAKMAAMEKKKEQIQRKAFDVNKKLMIAQAIASTAAGIAATLPLLGIPGMQGVAVALMAMIAGIGAAQVGIISGLSFQGGSSEAPSAPPSAIDIGKRDDKVDVSRGATSGETGYLRGGQGTGNNANNFKTAANGIRSYASGGEILVGERGPEVISPLSPMEITPNSKIGGGTSNVNFTINAVDATGVQELLVAQRGNIIGMIREAANEHGEQFMEGINTNSYGGESI